VDDREVPGREDLALRHVSIDSEHRYLTPGLEVHTGEDGDAGDNESERTDGQRRPATMSDRVEPKRG
jgi:hypothetical protein